MSVMPICTVERNLPGSDASANARRDPLTPFSTKPARRAGREDTMANSDIERRPLMTIRTVTIPSSRDNTMVPSGCEAVNIGDPFRSRYGAKKEQDIYSGVRIHKAF